MKFYIIGDSHTHRLRMSADEDVVKECDWGELDSVEPTNSNCEEYHLSKSLNLPIEIYYSGHKGRTAYTLSFREGFPCIKETMDDEDIV
mgnify:FL=1